MKTRRILFISVLAAIALSGCTKKDLQTPVGPESNQSLEGLWETNGIALLNSSNVRYSMNFRNGSLAWDVKGYARSYPGNQFVYKDESSNKFSYIVDNSFIKILLPDGNAYGPSQIHYHYSIEGSRLTLDAGAIYIGNSNNLAGTMWDINGIKYIYNPDNTGLIIYNLSDTVKFTYQLNANIIVRNYERFGRKTSYTGIYEIKDNKLYIYDKPGTGQTEPETYISESIVLYKAASPEAETKDYFPLKKDNSWTFAYSYTPAGSYGREWTTGILNWTITNNGTTEGSADREYYTVREILNGKTIRNSGTISDTVYIGPDTTRFNITEDEFHRISINSALTKLGQVNIKRYYSINIPDTITVGTVNYTSHSISLIKAEGIKHWMFGGGSNGDLSGSLTLIKAEVVK